MHQNADSQQAKVFDLQESNAGPSEKSLKCCHGEVGDAQAKRQLSIEIQPHLLHLKRYSVGEASKQRRSVDYAVEGKRPEKCKAPNVLREVEVLCCSWLDIEWPVEGGKVGRHIIQRRWIIDTDTGIIFSPHGQQHGPRHLMNLDIRC